MSSAGVVKQYFTNLDPVVDDQNEAIRATGFLKADNFGEDNEFILNPDIDNYSVTQADLKTFQKSLTGKFRNAAQLKFLCLMFFACHGMSLNGTQQIVLNQFDTKMQFYKIYDIENKIRLFSKLFKNCYLISIFACCREIFRSHKHTDCIGANSLAAAIAQIESNQKKEIIKKKTQIEKEEKTKTLEVENEKLRDENQKLKKQVKKFSDNVEKSEDVKEEDPLKGSAQKEQVEQEESKVGPSRGKDSLIEDVFVQNFMMIFGAKPGDGVSTDTKLIPDVMRCFENYYDRLTYTITFPNILACLQGSDTNIEIVQSSMLKFARLAIECYPTFKSIGLIFLQ